MINLFISCVSIQIARRKVRRGEESVSFTIFKIFLFIAVDQVKKITKIETIS